MLQEMSAKKFLKHNITRIFFPFQTVTLTHHGLRSPMEYSCEENGSVFRVPTVSRSLWSGRCPAPLSKTCEKTKGWLSQLKSAAVFRCLAWSPTSIVSRLWNLHWRVSFFFKLSIRTPFKIFCPWVDFKGQVPLVKGLTGKILIWSVKFLSKTSESS